MLLMNKFILIFFFLLFTINSYAEHQPISYDFNQWYRYEIKSKKNFNKFNFDLIKDKYISKQIQNNKSSGLISYLLFEDNKIVIDESNIPGWIRDFGPNQRNNYLASYSVGKSLVSYILGHSICEGYIRGIDAELNDWSILDNTLYHGQKLIDLLNMTAGDQKYIGQRPNVTKKDFYDNMDTYLKGTKIYVYGIPLKNLMKYYFQNSKKDKPVYNYSGMATTIIFNYIHYKAGENFDKLLSKIFAEHIKIGDNVYFQKNNPDLSLSSLNNHFYAKRYDYLRIAKAIMDDWNNDTCVGKYLKTVYEMRINKKREKFSNKAEFQYTKKYGGQFHFDLVGLTNRKIMAMGGYGGQSILIDFEKGRIIVVHSIDRHYNWKKIVYNKIKKK